MFSPFSVRYADLFESEEIQNLTSQLNKNKGNVLQQFYTLLLDHIRKVQVDRETLKLALDMAVNYYDVATVIDITNPLQYPLHYFYRAYAFHQLAQYNKIVSLKLNFENKFSNSLTQPRNALILTFLEFLKLIGNDDLKKAQVTYDELVLFWMDKKNEIDHNYFKLIVDKVAFDLFLELSAISKAEDLARGFLQYANENKDIFIRALSLNLISKVMILQGEFRKAKRFLNSSLIPIEEISNDYYRAIMLENSSQLAIAKRDYAKAIRVLKKVLEFDIKEVSNKAKVATNIAELYLELDEIENANKYLKIAIDTIKKDNLKIIKPYLLRVLSSIKEGNFQEAERFLEESKDKITTLNKGKHEAYLLYLKGLLHLHTNESKQAIDAFHKALAIGKRYNNYEVLFKTHARLVDVFIGDQIENLFPDGEDVFIKQTDYMACLAQEQFIPKIMCEFSIQKAYGLIFAGLYDEAKNTLSETATLSNKLKYYHLKNQAYDILKYLDYNIDNEKKMDREEYREFLGEKNFHTMKDVVSKYSYFKFLKEPRHYNPIFSSFGIVKEDSNEIIYTNEFDGKEIDTESEIEQFLQEHTLNDKSCLIHHLTPPSFNNKSFIIDKAKEYYLFAVSDKPCYKAKVGLDLLALQLEQSDDTLSNILNGEIKVEKDLTITE